MAMKTGFENKKQLIIASVLGVILLGVIGYNLMDYFGSGSTPAPAPAAVSAPTPVNPPAPRPAPPPPPRGPAQPPPPTAGANFAQMLGGAPDVLDRLLT